MEFWHFFSSETFLFKKTFAKVWFRHKEVHEKAVFGLRPQKRMHSVHPVEALRTGPLQCLRLQKVYLRGLHARLWENRLFI
jgi:hypothetical protein